MTVSRLHYHHHTELRKKHVFYNHIPTRFKQCPRAREQTVEPGKEPVDTITAAYTAKCRISCGASGRQREQKSCRRFFTLSIFNRDGKQGRKHRRIITAQRQVQHVDDLRQSAPPSQHEQHTHSSFILHTETYAGDRYILLRARTHPECLHYSWE